MSIHPLYMILLLSWSYCLRVLRGLVTIQHFVIGRCRQRLRPCHWLHPRRICPTPKLRHRRYCRTDHTHRVIISQTHAGVCIRRMQARTHAHRHACKHVCKARTHANTHARPRTCTNTQTQARAREQPDAHNPIRTLDSAYTTNNIVWRSIGILVAECLAHS